MKNYLRDSASACRRPCTVPHDLHVANHLRLVLKNVSTTHVGSTGSAIRSEQIYFDQFGRTTHSYAEGLDGVWSYTSKGFDARGNVNFEYEPYKSGTSNYPYRQYSYDLLGRRTVSSRWLSATNSTWVTTTTYYEGLTVRTVDPQSKTNKIVSNAIGQARRTIDTSGYYKQFDFDAFGNAIRVTDNYGSTNQSASFNVRGLRYQSVDSDMGTWNYAFNSLGEMTQHTDAKGQIVGYSYDALSRPTQKTEPSPISGTISSYWVWGNSAPSKNIGRLYEASISGGGATQYVERSNFDSYGRPLQTDIYDGAGYHYFNYGYNSAGQLEVIAYPTSTSGYRHQVVNVYTGGQLKYVRDGLYGPNYWTANAADARGQVTDETLSNGLRTTRNIDAVTGLPSYIRTGPGGGSSVQNLNYTWDLVGNLASRNDANQSLTEAFVYDGVYRLDYSTLNGTQNLNVDYDAMGNITSKSDVGSYTYAGPRMHAVTNVAGVAYNYDSNGNITSRGSSTVSYYAHNKPYQMSNGTFTSTFEYGPNGNYWKQTATYSNGTETTKYIGGLLEIVQGPSVTSYRHHIKANGRTVAIYSRGSNGANNTIYSLTDHLGSTDAVTNSSGTIIVKESFAAFGTRRNGATWSGAPSGADMTAIGDATRRGYTDHSMLDNIGLIHMNGRVMDPTIGRFVSPDPFIDGALDTQGWNRYAYVQNRPLALTDPSGFGKSGPGGGGGRVMPIDGDGGIVDGDTENRITNGSLIQSLRFDRTHGMDNIPPQQQMSMADRVNSMLYGFTGVSGPVDVTRTSSWTYVPSVGGSVEDMDGNVVTPERYRPGYWQHVPSSGRMSGGGLLGSSIALLRAFAPLSLVYRDLPRNDRCRAPPISRTSPQGVTSTLATSASMNVRTTPITGFVVSYTESSGGSAGLYVGYGLVSSSATNLSPRFAGSVSQSEGTPYGFGGRISFSFPGYQSNLFANGTGVAGNFGPNLNFGSPNATATVGLRLPVSPISQLFFGDGC